MSLLASLMLLVSARGAVPSEVPSGTADDARPDPRIARWEAVEAPEVVEPDDRVSRWIPWEDGSVIGLRCPGEGPPEVVALSKGARIEGDFISPGLEVGTWQIVPPAAVRWSGFVVRDAACEVQRRRTSATPWAWALAEARGTVDADRARLAGPDAAAWAGIDPLRQAALRPPGPQPVGVRRLFAGRESVPLVGRDWVRLSTDEDVRLTGPVRVRVDLRALGEAPGTCLFLDGNLLCQPSTPGRATTLQDARLSYGPRTLDDGTPVHALRTWLLGLGPGEHRLRMDRDVLARISVHRVEVFGDATPRKADLQASAGLAIYTPPPRPDWETAPFVEAEDSGEGRWFGRQGAPTLDGAAWQPVDDVHPEATLAETGEVALWLEPEADDALCRVRVDDTWFAARAPRGVHRFGWVGPSAVERPELEALGCGAWVHTVGPSGPASRSLAYLRVLLPGERVDVQPDPARPTRLEVSVPRGDGSRTVRALGREGQEVMFSLDPSTEDVGRRDELGRSWTDPLYLPLPPSAGWRLSADEEVAIRVRQIPVEPPTEGAAPADAPTGTRGEATFAEVDASEAAVRGLTAELPSAPHAAARAALLVERGGLFAARGAWVLAARDLLRAEELDPDTAGLDTPVGLGLRLERERSLHGADRWRASDPRWVTLERASPTEVDRVRAEAAARGDYLAVAERSSGTDAARWWRRAILGGQVLTAAQRLEAFLVAIALGEHPDLQLLRSGTRWDGVHLVEGAARRSTIRWPLPRDPDEDLLYPDAWPAERIVPLRRGWLLRIPPRAQGQALHLRCLVRALGTTGPCRMLAEDADGNVLAEAMLSGWGTPDALWLPPGPAAYLRLDEPYGAHAQLLWTGGGEVPGHERLAHEARAGEPLTATVLGPTAVRADVVAQGDAPVTVRVAVSDNEVSREIVGQGEVIVPALREGPVQVRISTDAPAWVRVATRRARRGGPLATEDRRAVARAEIELPEPEEPGSYARPLPRGAQGMPAGRPARTWVAGLTVGSAEWTPPEARGPEGAPPAVTASGGLQARAREDLWASAGVSVQGRLDGAVIGVLEGGGDWRLTRGRTRLYGIGDLDLAVGPFAGRTLGGGRLDLGVRAVHPVWAGGTFQARAEVRGRARTALDPELPYEPNKTRLWSRYAEDHRLQLAASAMLRHRFGPWIVARGGFRAASNAPNDPLPVDHVGVDASVDLSRASLFTRVGTGLEVRFEDEHRKDPFLSWVLDGRVTWFPWVTVRTGVHPWAGLRWRPTDRKASVMLGVEGRFGAPRALEDVRPSHIASRHVGEWGFWQQALRRWPAGGADAADEDWAPPGIEPVEVAP